MLRYLGVYEGPSYFGMDLDRLAGFRSVKHARDYFLDFQYGRVWYDEYRENEDGNYVLWQESGWSYTPGTTEEDTLTLYSVMSVGKGLWLRSEEPAYQISCGSRRRTTRIEKL